MGDLGRAKMEFEATVHAGEGKTLIDMDKSNFLAAQARLAALNSGAPQPVIPSPPKRADAPNALPTPALVLPRGVPASAAAGGQRVALVIGNSEYGIGRLANPRQDADAISALLKQTGFTAVTIIRDVKREELVNALRAFAEQADKADWAVVYYAGHGVEIGGVNYLLPIDAKLASDRDVQFEGVPLEQALTSIEQAKKLRLVFFDACRDNPFLPQMRRTPAAAPVALDRSGPIAVATRSVGRGLGRAELGKQTGGTLVVYSAKHGQTALDGEGANSPFAIALAQRLATPGVEINKMLRLVRDDVMEATAGRQEPYTYGSLPGSEDFFFVAEK